MKKSCERLDSGVLMDVPGFRITTTDAGPHPCDLTLGEGELIGSRYERAVAIDANRGLSVYFAPYPGYYNDAMRRPDGDAPVCGGRCARQSNPCP